MYEVYDGVVAVRVCTDGVDTRSSAADMVKDRRFEQLVASFAVSM
jgi:hypothetical protein